MYPDVERLRIEGEDSMEGLEHITWALREAEATRVSTRRDVTKESLVNEGVSKPPNSTKRIQKINLSPTKPNVHSPLKAVLNTTREAEAIRGSTRRDVAKESLVNEGVSKPPNSTKRIQKTNLSPTKPNVHSPLKTVLNTTRKYKDNRTFINHR